MSQKTFESLRDKWLVVIGEQHYAELHGLPSVAGSKLYIIIVNSVELRLRFRYAFLGILRDIRGLEPMAGLDRSMPKTEVNLAASSRNFIPYVNYFSQGQ